MLFGESVRTWLLSVVHSLFIYPSVQSFVLLLSIFCIALYQLVTSTAPSCPNPLPTSRASSREASSAPKPGKFPSGTVRDVLVSAKVPGNLAAPWLQQELTAFCSLLPTAARRKAAGSCPPPPREEHRPPHSSCTQEDRQPWQTPLHHPREREKKLFSTPETGIRAHTGLIFPPQALNAGI